MSDESRPSTESRSAETLLRTTVLGGSETLFGIFSRPLQNLDGEDLRDLVETRKVRERLRFDHKPGAYDHGHSGSVEMLADVTAMANAPGGCIVIGVEVDKTQPDGTPKAIVGVTDGGQEATWLQSVCLSSVDERIPGLGIRDIPLSTGGPAWSQRCLTV